MGGARIGWLAALCLTACAPSIPEGTYVCASAADCPPGMVCASSGLCHRSVDAGPCEPQDCATLRANCGVVTDACGNELDCGECPDDEGCGAGGIPNICACAPRACQPSQCETVDDGCGGLIDCGGCPSGEPCREGVCTCAPQSCAGAGAECGVIPDGCGGSVECPVCGLDESCGAQEPNRCGIGPCVPLTCGDADAECGMISDGCDRLVDCGPCAAPDTCGGGGAGANRCGCTAETCADYAAQCGELFDICGNRMDCGTCSPGYGCSSNRCVCSPDVAEPNETSGAADDLGAAGDGFDMTYVAFNPHVSSDVDWYRWTPAVSTGTSIDLVVELTAIPAGRELLLDAFVVCVGSASEAVACDGSNTPIVDPTLGPGCRSANAGAADERVSVKVDCMPSAYYVRVAPSGPSPPLGRCDNYNLRFDLGVTGS